MMVAGRNLGAFEKSGRGGTVELHNTSLQILKALPPVANVP